MHTSRGILSSAVAVMFYTFVYIISSYASAAEFPPAGFQQVRSVLSPNGRFRILEFKKNLREYNSDSQVWIEALDPKFKTQCLFTYNNRIDWIVSEDEEHIAINYHEDSGTGSLHVFVKKRDGDFQMVQRDFTKSSEEIMKSKNNLKDDLGFDHEYCYADTWMRDGFLLAHLQGNLSGEYYLDNWYFIYKANIDEFVADLSQVNKGSFHKVKH